MERMPVKFRYVGDRRSRRKRAAKERFSWLVAIVAGAVVFGLAYRTYAPQWTRHAHAAQKSPGPPKHKITVRFDYDFDRTPPCSATAGKVCVKQFVVYDVSAGPLPTQRTQLFTFPVPPHAHGAMRNIKQVSPPLDFASGLHMISVTAQTPDPKNESSPPACTTWIEVP